MASGLQKLLRKSPAATRIITFLHTLQGEEEAIALRRCPFIEVHQPIHPSSSTHHSGSSRSNVIFPSFPFGFSSNPIWAIGSRSNEAEDADFEGDGDDNDDESGTLWADSVKKKRKRKMNKHKYKKLRKRLRRQK